MASNAQRPESVRIAVFAKAPVPGKVKTRLAGVLGDAGAAALHATLTRRALATAKAAGVGVVELWCDPGTEHPFFAECARTFGAVLRSQRGDDLGERMQDAFATVHAEGAALVMIGSDCAALTAPDLRRAADALANVECVIAPAEDGGYALIALATPHPELFADMRWGTDLVMQETRRRLDARATRWTELPLTWDVDRPEDYARLVASGLVVEDLAGRFAP